MDLYLNKLIILSQAIEQNLLPSAWSERGVSRPYRGHHGVQRHPRMEDRERSEDFGVIKGVCECPGQEEDYTFVV